MTCTALSTVAREQTAFLRPPESALCDAEDAMTMLLGQPPLLSPKAMPDGVRITQRWRHGPLKGHMPALSDHLIMTFHSAPRPMRWRSGTMRIASRAQIGSISIIPQGRDGHWDIDGPIETSQIYLSDDRLQSCADVVARGKAVELIDRTGFADPVAARIMRMLSGEQMPDDAYSQLFFDQAIELLCVQLVRGHSSVCTISHDTKRKGGLADWQVNRVTGYMRERLDRDISLGDLADLLKLSRFHFCTSFRLATGQTPHECLTALRIEKARERLTVSSSSITEIALEVGYETPSAFAASFRRLTEMTPSEYRREFGRSRSN